jgi:adenylyltransferase/sulfurtransferase
LNVDVEESRYDRQERIWWWDQSRLLTSRVLVVGAGALGNEIVKNLVLVGVGRIDVIDMDDIENSNLARCVFFTEADQGRPKAVVLAEAARRLNPDVVITPFVRPVQTLGAGSLVDYDMVIAGLDNREARLWLNAACRRLGKYWIDGAIEGLQGLARVFGPDGPCYECTLSEADLAQLGHRRSCALLSPEDLALGRTPTNATTASIIAGVEVQEAIKLLVGRPELLALEGKVWRLEGETMLTSTMEYVENDFCMAHDRVSIRGEAIGVSGLPQRVGHLIAEDPARGEFIAIDMPDDLIRIEPCSECGAGETILGLRPTLPLGAGRCDSCQADRPIASRTSLEADHPWIVEEWSTIRWPDAEIVGVRFSEDTIYEIVRSEA